MRKLRIDITTSVTHRDFDLPAEWDDLSEHDQAQIIRDHSDRLVAEVIDPYGEVVEVDDALTSTPEGS